MGLPMAKLAIATNSNDILARFWKSGAYDKAADSSPGDVAAAAPAHGSSDGKQASSGGVLETLSPAMDILVSSNFERLLWYLSYQSITDGEEASRHRKAGEQLASWMNSVKADGRVQLSKEILESAKRDFVAEKVTDEQVYSIVIRSFDISLHPIFRLYQQSGLTTRTKQHPTSPIPTQQSDSPQLGA